MLFTMGIVAQLHYYQTMYVQNSVLALYNQILGNYLYLFFFIIPVCFDNYFYYDLYKKYKRVMQMWVNTFVLIR